MERVLNNYTHLRGKYLGCFCKDEMDKLLSKLKTNIIQEVNPRAFALINTAESHTRGEHWMGLMINKTTNSSGYFDSFGRNFTWLNNTLMIRTITPNHNTIKHNPPRYTYVVMVSIYPPRHEGS